MYIFPSYSSCNPVKKLRNKYISYSCYNRKSNNLKVLHSTWSKEAFTNKNYTRLVPLDWLNVKDWDYTCGCDVLLRRIQETEQQFCFVLLTTQYLTYRLHSLGRYLEDQSLFCQNGLSEMEHCICSGRTLQSFSVHYLLLRSQITLKKVNEGVFIIWHRTLTDHLSQYNNTNYIFKVTATVFFLTKSVTQQHCSDQLTNDIDFKSFTWKPLFFNIC